ncbi:MAG: CDP-glycerol glycerophosphotransferase family protein, partial [Candidatus Delongbacteria bacterium]|nr:CDP-glycerol glycerophosphotransferase family protein [Candidatus Delongbacteria bacterium]
MAIGKLIITRFADLGHLGLYLLSYLIPRKKNVWVFGSWFGQNYSDNSKYFFEYVNQFTSIKAIWISQNREVVKSIQSKGYKAFHYKSMKAAYYISIAKVGVVSCAPHDIASYSLAKMKIINLWHGTALKKIMHDVKGYEKSGFVHELHRFLFPFKFISFSMISA